MGAHRLSEGNHHAIPAGALITAARRDFHHDGDASPPKPDGLIARELQYCSLRRPSAPREDVVSPVRGGSRPGQTTPPRSGPAGPPPLMPPHHPVAPGAQPVSPVAAQPRTEWSPVDGKLHIVRPNDVQAAFFVGFARAVCGHQIGRGQQPATPPDSEVCWACLFAGARCGAELEPAAVLSGDPHA